MSGIIQTIGKIIGLLPEKRQEIYVPPPIKASEPSRSQIENEQAKLQAQKKIEQDKAYKERVAQAQQGLSGTLLGGSLAPNSTLIKKKLLG